ncbi:MAG: alpha/beta fold hydrolase [Janthinobacterium lividum]
MTHHPGRSAFIQTGGVRIHYLSWNLEQPEKPPLLLIHGFRAHAHWWDAIVPSLIDDYRVVAMDFSGMGDSDFRAHYRAMEMVAEITGVIDALELGPVTAIAHSYGGARLLYACAERPELFRRAIIIDSYVRFDDEAGFNGPRDMGSVRIHPDFDMACARFRLMPEQPDAVPELLAHVARHSLRRVEGGWRWKFDHAMRLDREGEIGGERLLPRITTPVDFIYGEHSRVVSGAHARRICGLLPHAGEPVMVANSYHHLMLDQPVALTEVLHTCLERTR